MKFEKINDDKIKITLSSADLEANDLDLHSFMSEWNTIIILICSR